MGNRPGPGPGNYPGVGNRPGGYPNGNPNWNNRPNWINGNPNWAYRPGWSNHQAWVNGYWHGQNNRGWWNNGGAFWTGMALGGIGGWGIGSSVFNWGYQPFVNPYVVQQPIIIQQPVVVDQPVVAQQPAAMAPPVDYSQPLNTSVEPDPATADPAYQTFDAARAAFKEGNYADALTKTDETLKAVPNDAAVNEFRALCLFALKQYEPAAGTLYAVLSVGPGWDWTTLIGLYSGIDAYTQQLRTLEDFVRANPQSAPARFLLGYHYLTQGHTDAAVGELREVVKLEPSDQLSAQLVKQLTSEGNAVADAGNANANPPASAAGDQPPAAPAQTHSLVGTWNAVPAPGDAIELNIAEDGSFKWTFTTKGQPRVIAGKYVLEEGILTMTESENNALVGRVVWQDEKHFSFQAMGGGPNDPGLAFSKP